MNERDDPLQPQGTAAMTTKLELFTSPSAFPNPQRLRIFMHEKGIADQFNEHVYDMAPVGEQRQWRHLKMNPWGETPTLKLATAALFPRRPPSPAISTSPCPGGRSWARPHWNRV
jgi:hypothetical protein